MNTLPERLLITTERCKASHPDFQKLIGELDHVLLERYGEMQNSYNSLNKVKELDTVVVVYANDEPVGCGCFRKIEDNIAELKRMYVKATFRKSRVANILLRELENWVEEKGYKKTILETGINQPEAIAFYEKHRYKRIPNYGEYKDNPNSVCFTKQIAF